MRRIHLFEWEDQAWFPEVLRDYLTDHLRFLQAQGIRRPIHQAIARRLRSMLSRSGSRRIVDLCAGAGGPLLAIRRVLVEDLDTPVEVVLTDLYPNASAFRKHAAEGGGAVKVRYESTSAFDVPDDLPGLRTLFSAVHHFKPEDVQRILADAARKRQPIAIFEAQERTLRMLATVAVATVGQAWVLTPWIGNMSLRRFLFTYVIPFGPAAFLWDGLVSVMRSYTPQELRELAGTVDAPGYQWEVGRFDVFGPFGILFPTIYLLGMPTGPAGDAQQDVAGSKPDKRVRQRRGSRTRAPRI